MARNLRLPFDLEALAIAYAADNKVSVNTLIVDALTEYLSARGIRAEAVEDFAQVDEPEADLVEAEGVLEHLGGGVQALRAPLNRKERRQREIWVQAGFRPGRLPVGKPLGIFKK